MPNISPVPDPTDLTAWLIEHDWTQLGQGSPNARMWSRAGNEVLQPLARDASDYTRRTVELINSLATEADVDADSLALDIAYRGADVAEWSAEAGVDATLSLEDGERLVVGARRAFVAAALATEQHRGYFGRSITQLAREHAKRVRMAQTRVGSYVIPVVSPLPLSDELPPESTLDVTVEAQPFERRVMVQLMDGLSAVSRLSSNFRMPPMSVLNESVSEGVSYELCNAVSQSLKSSSFGDLNVSFKWSPRLRSGRRDSVVTFPQAAQQTIETMANSLRNSDLVAEQTIVGTVHGYVDREEEGGGVVTMNAIVGGDRHLVRMVVEEADLSAALRARVQRRAVMARGRLSRPRGRTWELNDLVFFTAAEMLPSDLDAD